MISVTEVIDFVRPPAGADPAVVQRYRFNMTLVVLALIANAFWGYFAFARASEVKEQLAAAVKPVSTDVGEIKTQLLSQGGKLDRAISAQRDQLLDSIRAQIVEFKVRQCRAMRDKTANPNLMEVYREQVTRLENQYLQIDKAPRFTAPLCTDL